MTISATTPALIDHPTNGPTAAGRRGFSPTGLAVRATTTLAAVGLLVAATACSSSGDAATVAPTTAPTTIAAPPPTTAAPTTAAPPATTVAPSSTAAPNAARLAMLNEILQAHHDAGEFVGARIALRDPDGTVTEAVAGTPALDPASGPVDPDVAWGIGSVTKTFVAVVVLQLAQEGRIDLDAGIQRYVPTLSGADRITPRQLLQHTSGLAEYNDQPAVLNDAQRPWTPTELIAVAEAAGRVGEPGAAFHYSNTNYIILGEIIQQVTGHPWADEVRTRIVQPLGMTNTSEMGADSAPGFLGRDGSFVDGTTRWNTSTGGSAGALQSTDHDLLLFARALADGTLLSPESQAAMRSFVPGEDYSQFGIVHRYGLGLEEYSNGAIAVDGHMGTGAAHAAFLGFDLAHGTAVAVSMNTANPGPQAIMAVEALMAAGNPA